MNDFGKKTARQLSAKNIQIIGKQAIPGFEGDKFFSDTAYKLNFEGKSFLRTHAQVCAIAASSWDPKTDLV